MINLDLTMGLSPSVRGQGLGEGLLRLAIERVRSENLSLLQQGDHRCGQGIEILYLMVREDNKSALGLYSKLGFEKVCILHKDTKISDYLYYDGIMMRLFIGAPSD